MAKVRIYLTQSCPYCRRAINLLKKRGLGKMEVIDVGRNKNRWASMQRETKRSTVPQIFINETHVGGFDDLSRLDKSGKLKPLLNTPQK